jgi:hypothetical protein
LRYALYQAALIATYHNDRFRALFIRYLQVDCNPAKCISCNSCFKPGIEEGGIYCVVEKREGKGG